MLVAALCIAGVVLSKPPSGGLTQAEAEAAVRAVLAEIQSIRGLTLTEQVPVTVIDDTKARAYALLRLRRMIPEAKMQADQTVYRLLGLVPPDLDLLKTLLDVLEEQAGGYYDPGTRSLYLLDDMPKEIAELLVAHEMTHALEDQRYDIDGRLAKSKHDDDATFALSSVVEGSATIAAAAYVAHRAAAGVDDFASVRTDRLSAMPAVMRRQLLGPYVLGMTFLKHGVVEPRAKGFPRREVNAAWAHPPRSSEQILHPEKYWDPKRRDEPKRVSFSSPLRRLGDGWTRAISGVLGELTLGSLVGCETPDANDLAAGRDPWTNAAASGWGGDRFELWTNDDAAVVLLATVWDTEKDAVEFLAALPHGRGQFATRRAGSRVGIVAGAAGDLSFALLDLLVRP